MISEKLQVLLSAADFLRVVSAEETDESQAKLVLRVMSDAAWFSILPRLLVAANPEDGSFGMEAHKVFHVGGHGVQYTWVLLAWGDVEGVQEGISTALSVPPPVQPPAPKRATPPASALGRRVSKPKAAPLSDDDGDLPPAHTRSWQNEGKHNIKAVERRRHKEGWEFTETTVGLQHVRGEMFMKAPAKTLTLGSRDSRHLYATVQGRGESEFNPAEEQI